VAGEHRAGLLPLNTGVRDHLEGIFFRLLRGRLPPRPLWRAGAERSEGPPVLGLVSSFVVVRGTWFVLAEAGGTCK